MDISTPRLPKGRRISPVRIFSQAHVTHVEIATTEEKSTQTDSLFSDAGTSELFRYICNKNYDFLAVICYSFLAFQSYIVNKFVELKQAVSQVQQLVVNLEVGSSSLSHTTTVEADEWDFLPCGTLESWEAFDSTLVDSNTFTKLVRFCPNYLSIRVPFRKLSGTAIVKDGIFSRSRLISASWLVVPANVKMYSPS